MEVKLCLPSNGTEGSIFTAKWCDNCSKEKRCPILIQTMTTGEVKEWIYKENKPTCTAFKEIGTPNKKRKCKHSQDLKLF